MRIVTEFSRPVREIENLWIPLADGTRFAARAWLPKDAERDPVPAILERIPYRKRDGTVWRGEQMHPDVAAGQRIRLAISTSYWPMMWPSPEPVTLTVHADES